MATKAKTPKTLDSKTYALGEIEPLAPKPAVPINHRLTIPAPRAGALSVEGQKTLDTYMWRVCNTVGDEAELMQDRDRLLANTAGSLEDVLEEGDGLRLRREEIQAKQREIFGEKFIVVAALLPEFVRILGETEQAEQATIDAGIEELKSQGAVEAAFGGLANPDAAVARMTRFVKANSVAYFAAHAKVELARVDVDLMRTWAEIGKNRNHSALIVRWPVPTTETARRIAELAGVLTIDAGKTMSIEPVGNGLLEIEVDPANPPIRVGEEELAAVADYLN
jgi:hypothetical protein